MTEEPGEVRVEEMRHDAALKAFRSEDLYPVHGTNLVKCHTVKRIYEHEERFRELVEVGAALHLRTELLALRPRIVLLLGQPVVEGFNDAFGLNVPWPPNSVSKRFRIDDLEADALAFYHPMYGGRNSSAFLPVLRRFTSVLAELIAAS